MSLIQCVALRKAINKSVRVTSTCSGLGEDSAEDDVCWRHTGTRFQTRTATLFFLDWL